jgi:hypothetical protein
MHMANVVVFLKKINPFGKRERPCYLGLPPPPKEPVLKIVTMHEGGKMVNWLAKPSGIHKSLGTPAVDPLTPDKLRTLLGG